jgi:NTE family protein
VEAILASTAIQPIFGAVHNGTRAYWDGLYSENPAIRELPDADPDEIWVIQINPLFGAGPFMVMTGFHRQVQSTPQ